MDISITDAASGGVLRDMTHFESRSLIEKMASNSQQFNARSSDDIVIRGVHDVGTNAMRVYGICTSPDHYIDANIYNLRIMLQTFTTTDFIQS
ncbi:hypothetical protein Lal_00031408 [Lupinus albus]|nr:hypothetical protein Lal_00031408 [Lupinus albus]